MVEIRQQMTGTRCWGEAEAAFSRGDPLALIRTRSRADDGHLRASLITSTVEAEVIPRLLLSRRRGAPPRLAAPTPAASDIDDLVGLLLAQDRETAERFVERLGQSGVSPESLYLDLLAPSARRLGVLWEEDLCSFSDVTIGLLRLQTVLRDLGPLFRGGTTAGALGPRALLVPMPGEQHTFGLAMVVEFFRRGGWQVWSGALAKGGDLLSLVRREWFDIVGISVGCGEHLETVAAAVRSVRRASANPAIGIMVGGFAFSELPQLAARVGADATAIDGRQAVTQARTLLTLLTDRG